MLSRGDGPRVMVGHLLVAAPRGASLAGPLGAATRLFGVGRVLAGGAEAGDVDGLVLAPGLAVMPAPAAVGDVEVTWVAAGDEVFLAAVAHGCGCCGESVG